MQGTLAASTWPDVTFVSGHDRQPAAISPRNGLRGAGSLPCL